MSTTDLKLTYTDLQEGSGEEAKKGQRVSVHYTGWLNMDGEKGLEFDSSHSRNQAFDFKLGVGQVIQGWDEGVQGMKVGGKRTLMIPAHLAYGEHGAGDLIPANANLIFDVELLEIL